MLMSSQARDPHMLSLERVSRPMQAVGIDFFERGGHKYLLLMDHFSGMPHYERMGMRRVWRSRGVVVPSEDGWSLSTRAGQGAITGGDTEDYTAK